MTTLSIEVTEELAKAVEDLARLPEGEQKQYAQRIYELRLAELRAEVRKGLDELDQGLGTPLDMEEIKRKARAQWENRNSPKAG
jgi:predicted transcriptional regulator